MRPRLYDLLPGASLFAPVAFSTPSPPPCRRAPRAAPGIRPRPSGVYYTNIRYGPTRFGLRTFKTSQAAPHTYHAAAWRLGRPRTQMNFPEVQVREEAQAHTPPPRLSTAKERRIQQRRERCLLILDTNEQAKTV
ncbi:putative AP2 protein [Hordeum vulgare]|nr:putative AP2 protein [Hordeum vulgare]